MSRLIENIAKRIDRLIELSLDKWDGGASEKAYKICKDIIQEEAKKYNNGWIPCSERLPEANEKVLVFDVIEGISIERLEEGYSFIETVLAWQPLPEAYKEGCE